MIDRGKGIFGANGDAILFPPCPMSHDHDMIAIEIGLGQTVVNEGRTVRRGDGCEACCPGDEGEKQAEGENGETHEQGSDLQCRSGRNRCFE